MNFSDFLYQVSSSLLSKYYQKTENNTGKNNDKPLTKEIVERLNVLATKKLNDIVEKRQADVRGSGLGQGELTAIQELLKHH